MTDLVIDGGPLDVTSLVRFGSGTDRLLTTDEVRNRVARGRAIVDDLLASGQAIYGLTTALGSKVSTRLDPHSAREREVVTGRMVGFGDPYPENVARTAMAIRMHGLGRGAAGVSLHVVETLERIINAGIVVRAPQMGSIGASDLAPGAALAGALLGIGSVWCDGEVVDAADALRRRGIDPVVMAPKDALGVLNSSCFSLAHAAHVVEACRGVLAASIVCAVANADAFGVHPRVYAPDVQALRPLPHAAEVAALVSDLLAGSWVHEAVSTPQQAISFRAVVPQFASVIGALDHFAVAVAREINGVGDNPVVLLESREMASSSHFHTIDLALHGDALSLSLYHWAEACVQRMQRTINHRHADVPALLAVGDEAATGLNPLQKTIGDLRGRMRHLANPASLDGLVVSDQVEDLASQLPMVVRKLDEQVAVLGRLATLEALVGLQCHAVRPPHQRGRASASIESFFVEIPMPLADDVPIGPILEQMHHRLHDLVDQALSDVAGLWADGPL